MADKKNQNICIGASCCLGIIVVLILFGSLGGSSDSDYSSSSVDTSSSSDGIATTNYDSDTGITYGTTDDGYGYAYNDQGDVAVSDGETTVIHDG